MVSLARSLNVGQGGLQDTAVTYLKSYTSFVCTCTYNIGFPFKGIVSRAKYFIEGPKNQIRTFCMSADSVHNIGLLFLL
jgi:hypothetical protein